MPHIILIGTLDTKLEEFIYIHEQLQALSSSNRSPLKITLIDCGRANTQHASITISQKDLIERYGKNKSTEDAQSLQRGELIKFMIDCSTACVKDLIRTQEVHGILSAGGSGGTSLVSQVMREAAPLGMPKLIVSTVASGDTGPVVGETDITMMYSVVDIAGTNELLRIILSNAAGAMVGMSVAYERNLGERKKTANQDSSPVTRIGITMFGVTTPCVTNIVRHLNQHHLVEIYVFHATGHGGKAMERMVEEGRLDAVLDLTTTEICDLLFGGNMSAGPKRLEAALVAGIPNIISVGATDMVNFGPMSSVPPEYQDRQLLEHNPTVTLMRTTEKECIAVGEFIVDKIKNYAKDQQLVEVWVPYGGNSMIATQGQIFADQTADSALAESLRDGLKETHVRMKESKLALSDELFSIDIADSLMQLVERKKGSRIPVAEDSARV